MYKERVIKVTRCGDQICSAFGDRVSIEFSPSELTSMVIHFHDQAMKAENYGTQTEMREMVDAFKKANEIWAEARRDINEH